MRLFRTAAIDSDTNFNRTQTGRDYTFTLKPNVQVTLRAEAVTQARQTIERRVNELGVAEPSIAQQGANGDEILVQLPGVSDVDRAKAVIGSPGLLELKIVENGPVATREELMVNGQVPEGMEILPGVSDVSAGGPATHRLLPAPQGRCRERTRPADGPPVARRAKSSRSQLHAQRRGRHAGSATSPKRTSAGTWRSCSTAACSPRRASRAGSPPTAAFPAASRSRKCRTCRSCCGLARCPRGSPISKSARSVRASAPTQSDPASRRRSSASS